MQLDEITSLIDSEVSSGELIANVEAVLTIDRFFTFPKFMESARMVARKLADCGLESRVLEQPADGESRVGDWTMPLAWDCREAVLELLAPEARVLCRRSQDPNCTVMWSAPTGPGGVEAEVVGPLVGNFDRKTKKQETLIVERDGPRPVREGDLAGKIVYTTSDPRRIKRLLIDSKALGVISSFMPKRRELPDNRFWVNGWSDDPGAWAFTAQDTPMWGFVLTPAEGDELEKLLAAGPVRVRATVDSRLYAGVLPAATGLLRGDSNEEILSLGHQFEVGADDNASAAAVMLESARILGKLISEGKLPRPRRSLRYLFVSECYGSMAYAEMNPRLTRRTLAAMNLDCVGGHQRLTEMPMPVHMSAPANPSVAETLILRLCTGYLAKRDPYFAWHKVPFEPCDSSICDPAIGIPTVYLGGKDKFWHTNADTIDKIDPEATSRAAVLAASFAYFLASAGSEEAEWLAEEAAADGRARLAELGAAWAAELRAAEPAGLGAVLGRAAETLAHARDVAADRVRSSQKFSARTERSEFRAALRPMVSRLRKQAQLEEAYLQKLAARLADEAAPPGAAAPVAQPPERPEWWSEAEGLVPVRNFTGCATLDGIPRDQREGITSHRWVPSTTSVLFRCDGKRTLAEAVRLGLLDSPEAGKTVTDFLKLFRLLERHGLVELRPARKRVLAAAADD